METSRHALIAKTLHTTSREPGGFFCPLLRQVRILKRNPTWKIAGLSISKHKRFNDLSSFQYLKEFIQLWSKNDLCTAVFLPGFRRLSLVNREVFPMTGSSKSPGIYP